MTRGELIVRTTFNPSNASIVDEIKQKAAELINLIDGLNLSTESFEALKEANIDKADAIKYTAIACMLGVKAATAV